MVAIACAAAALAAAPAQAAKVTVGSPLGPTDDLFAYPQGGTFINSTPAASSFSPVTGTVVSWRAIIVNTTTPRVLRPVGDGTYTGVGSGTPRLPVLPPSISGPYPESLPIRAGDAFGVQFASGAIGSNNVAGATTLRWNPVLADGATAAPSSTYTGELVSISATIRYCVVPKLKGKSAKKAKQALRAADCKVGKVKRTKKERRRSQVLSQSVKPGRSISDTQPVKLKISRKRN